MFEKPIMSPWKIHGQQPYDNLLHIEVGTNVLHIAVDGTGMNARCIETGDKASGTNQADTLEKLVGEIAKRRSNELPLPLQTSIEERGHGY